MSASERVVLLMTKPQKATLNRRAAAMKVSVSEYLRRAALGESSEMASLQEMMQAAEQSITRANQALDRAFANMQARAAHRAEREKAVEAAARKEFHYRG